MKDQVVFMMLALLLTGCVGSPAPASTLVPTQAPPPSPAWVILTELPPTPPSQPGGIPIHYENIDITISNGLASGAATDRSTAESADGFAGGLPAYIRFTLSSYALQGGMLAPAIYIFPVAEYRLRSSLVNERMDSLISLLSDPGSSLDNLQILPVQEGKQLFQAQANVIHFRNGSGVRYLTQIDQYPAIASNQEMFYAFMGLSQDGKYFISAYLPLSAAFLPVDSEAQTVLPAEGIPYPSLSGTDEQFTTYYGKVAAKLNGTDPNDFNPALSALDALMESILVE